MTLMFVKYLHIVS